MASLAAEFNKEEEAYYKKKAYYRKNHRHLPALKNRRLQKHRKWRVVMYMLYKYKNLVSPQAS